MSEKIKFQCIICKKILKEPISLPCLCTSLCKDHVSNMVKKKSNLEIQCRDCRQVFIIPNGFKENKQFKGIIDMGIYLTHEEKVLKAEMKKTLSDINEFVDQLNFKAKEFSSTHFEYFSNLKRLIDLRRESLILKIHEISDEMIKKVEHADDSFKKAANKVLSHDILFDYSQEENDLNEIFRNCDIQIDALNQQKIQNTKRLAEIISKLSQFKLFEENLNKNKFEPDTFIFTSNLFGSLDIFINNENQNFNICTYETKQPKYKMQHFYYCYTCKLFDGRGVCLACTRICHKDHNIAYAKYGLFFCDCGDRKNKSCRAMNNT